MKIVIRGTDIARCTVGIQVPGAPWHAVTYAARPEEYLAILQRHLQEAGVNIADVQGIVVIAGEGSATAVRASVTLANVLAWTHGWTVEEIAIPAEATEEEMGEAVKRAVRVRVARPQYQHAPHITQSTHDVLKRKL